MSTLEADIQWQGTRDEVQLKYLYRRGSDTLFFFWTHFAKYALALERLARLPRTAWTAHSRTQYLLTVGGVRWGDRANPANSATAQPLYRILTDCT